jgi:hypothetical protein
VPRSNFALSRPLAAAATLVSFFAVSGLRAQEQTLQTAISNEFRYGIGQRFNQEQKETKEYLENLFNTRVYAGDFTLGFRIQIDKPREYGPDTIGVKEYYAEFRRDGLRARAGTFYNLVGRGLVFNSFESRPIGFDTQTEGVKLDYDDETFSAGAFGGRLDYADILTPTRVEPYLIRGASGEVRPIPEVGVGGSFLSVSGLKSTSFTRPFDAYLREAYVSGNYGGFRTYLNFADKRVPLDSTLMARYDSANYGYGAYVMLGYSNADFGITGEMKNYRFGLGDPDQLQNGGRPTRALPFQNPPSLVPEYDKTLLARNPHAPDFSDELGFQLEGLIYPTEDLTLTLIGAGGSRHNAWEARTDSTDTKYFVRLNDKPLSFPELKDIRYSPYWEIYGHGEYHLDDDVTLALGLQHRDNVVYAEGRGNEAGPPSAEIYRATTAMLESITSLTPRDNIHAILELQTVFDSQKETHATDSTAGFDGKFNNVLLTLEYSRSPRWAVNTRIEYTTTDDEQGGRHLWPVVGLTYRIGNAHTIGVQYGAERGGVVCTGGVCRQINPFDGFRLTVVSKL